MKQPRKRVEQVGYVEGPKDGSYFLRYWGEPDGVTKRQRRAVEVGTKNQFRSREEANLSVEAAVLRRQINAGVLGRTMGQVIAHFERDKMPLRGNTRILVRANLNHCREKWQDEPISELASPANSKRIEGWLNSLRRRQVRKNTPDLPVSLATKKNIRQQMSALFNFAMRQGYIPSMENPIRFVKIDRDAKPERRQTLTPGLLDSFFQDPEVPEYVKVMAQIARFTGLRISEIRGLKEEDFNLNAHPIELTVHRRLFRREVGPPKSEASGEPVPVCEELYEILSAWIKSPLFCPNTEGWMFASPRTGIAYSSEGTQSKILAPWGRKHGVKRMGWHTFRHSFKQFLDDNDVRDSVIKRLMRHSSYIVTERYGSGKKMEQLEAGLAIAVEAMRPKLVVVERKKKWA